VLAGEHDERAAFVSAHQWGIYPGTGWIDEAPGARGRIVNVPLKAFAGDETYVRLVDSVFRPALEGFRPQMLFVSAGFDAHWSDPLTSLGLSTRGFHEVSKALVALAEEHCGGRIVFVLEGGYDPANVANGAAAVFAALAGAGLGDDPGDSCPRPDPDPSARIDEIRAWNGFH
jgi:acetoin utilization deacetylase AcuC-like enzyme